MDMLSRCISKGLCEKYNVDVVIVGCFFLVLKTRSDYGYDLCQLYNILNDTYKKRYTSDMEHVIWCSLNGIINARPSKVVKQMLEMYLKDDSKQIKRQKIKHDVF
jgi:hypothetical protein